jgi:hypothetical protein
MLLAHLLLPLRRALVAASCSAGLLAAAAPFGELPDAGPHPVGFRTLAARDFSRPPLAAPGEPAEPTAGRLVPLHVWYPAAEAANEPALTLADYADALAYTADPASLDDARRTAARARFIGSIPELGGDRALAEREQARLLALAGRARHHAPPAPGTFPVVLFPEYYAPASNSVLAEYLASHGFVVVSPPMLSWKEVTWGGGNPPNFESYVADLQFALGALREFAPADRTRIAAMGVGISANAVAALQMRNPLVRLHVSLDGGLISPTEDATLKRTPYFDVTAMQAPMLFLWSPHPSLIPALMDQYRYAERLVLHLPGMSEYRYLNYGPLDGLIPGLLGPSPGDVAAGYAWAARYVRQFLSAHLRGDPAAHEFLAGTPEAAGAPAGLVQREVRPALPAPPSLTAVRQLITERGVAAFAELYRALKQHDPEPFTMAQLLELQVWAGTPGRDPDASMRKGIALVRLEAFPTSARVHYALAHAAAARHEHALARRHFEETLRLLPDDRDPSLDESFKTLIRQRTEDGLKRLPAQ